MRINQPVTDTEYLLSDTEAIVSMTDTKGRITYVNPYFIEVSGFTEEELMGKAHNIVRHPDMPPEGFEDLWNTLKQGVPWTGIVKNRRKNGDYYWVQANVTPVYESGQVVGYMSVRNKPSREIIQIVEPIYRQFREGRAKGLAIHRGGVVRTGLRGRLDNLAQLSLATRMALGQGLLAAALGCVGLAALFGYQPSSGQLASLALGGMSLVLWSWLRTSRGLLEQLKLATKVARHIAGGDMTTRFDAGGADEVGQLLRALRQVSLNLHTIVGDVRGNVDTMKMSIIEISNGNVSLSQRTEAQAASLQETAASLEQFVANMRQGAENSRQANRLSQAASGVAGRGRDVISTFGSTMDEINQSASKIVDIIGLIDGIAFQTNILALNASVEAARAGEQGRGFAVVAGEVRNLAGRSAAAAKEIKQLIGDAIGKVEAGGRQVGEATGTMDEIVKAVNDVSQIMSELAVLTQEQDQGITQINTAVIHLDQVTQHNAALVEKTAASSTSLVQLATQLQQSVGVFKLERSAA